MFSAHEILEPPDVEGIAYHLLREAQQDGCDAPDVRHVVHGLYFALDPHPPPETCGWYDLERLLIYYRPDVDERVECSTISHELGHLALDAWGIPLHTQDHTIVWQVARAIAMPRAAFLANLRRFGIGRELYAAYPLTTVQQVRLRAIELSSWLLLSLVVGVVRALARDLLAWVAQHHLHNPVTL
jgi:hypothetical protein